MKRPSAVRQKAHGTARIVAIIGIFGALLSSSAWAASYRWVDEKGTAHYSRRLEEVPERYRSSVSEPELPDITPNGTGPIPASSKSSSPANPLVMTKGGWLGISFIDQQPGPLGQEEPQLAVADVLPGGPADSAGFRPGDILLAIGSIPVRDLIAEAQKEGVPLSDVLTATFSKLAPGGRLKFEVMRGQDRILLAAQFATPTTEQLLLTRKREESSKQLARIDRSEQWLSSNANSNSDEQARVTAGLGPLYAEYSTVLRGVSRTADEPTLRAMLTDSINDRRLEVLYRLIAFFSFAQGRQITVCCGQIEHYRNFDRMLRDFLPVKSHFTRALDTADLSRLKSMRWTLQFIEPYQGAKSRLADVDERLKASEASLALNTEFAAIISELQRNAARGIKDPKLDARIARLPADARVSLETYRRQLVSHFAAQRQESEALEAEKRKRQETTDAQYRQYREAKAAYEAQQKLDAETSRLRAQEAADAARKEQDRHTQAKMQEVNKALATYHATLLPSGNELFDNAFRFQGQAVGLHQVTFKRMIESGVSVFETAAGKELLVSSLPLDLFTRAGQTKGLIVKVLGTKQAKNAVGGTLVLTHVEYLAELP